MNHRSSFILSTSHCYNIRRTLLINPVLRLEFETAPVLYLVLGFLSTLLGAWLYNRIAGVFGGIEFTTVDVA